MYFAAYPKPVFHKPSSKQHVINPTSRFIAAEIEVASFVGNQKPIYDVVRKWKGGTVGDGSLPELGFEINTAPAGGDLYVNQIKEICETLHSSGCSINYQCGLHVHVDARDMDFYDIRRLVRIYAAIEDAIFAMVPESRAKGYVDELGRPHQYCLPCGQKYLSAVEEGKLPYDKVRTDIARAVYGVPSTQDLKIKKRPPAKYNALNIHSWYYRKTIEARHYQGTLNASDIINWGIMWALIVDAATKLSDDEVAKLKDTPMANLVKVIGDNKRILQFVRDCVWSYGNQRMIEQLSVALTTPSKT